MSWDTNIDLVEDGDRVKQHRTRAAELRAVANWMKEPVAVKQMLAAALEYERMADEAEHAESPRA